MKMIEKFHKNIKFFNKEELLVLVHRKGIKADWKGWSMEWIEKILIEIIKILIWMLYKKKLKV